MRFIHSLQKKGEKMSAMSSFSIEEILRTAREAIRKSDRADRDIPIIAMTADAFSDDIKKCLDSGMDSHMAKPIDIREVARLLEKYFK